MLKRAEERLAGPTTVSILVVRKRSSTSFLENTCHCRISILIKCDLGIGGKMVESTADKTETDDCYQSTVGRRMWYRCIEFPSLLVCKYTDTGVIMGFVEVLFTSY